MPANNYYALRARIASDEYMRNDRETQDSVRLSDIRMMSIRDFDTAPTVMSSEFIERGAQVRDSILGAYSKYGDAVNKDFTLRSTLDLAMSLVLNKPYESVAKNHDAYKRIFTGQDLDDKSLGTAMADAWNSDQIANDIATLQRRKDATDDPEEEAFLEKQIMAKEREAVRLGDYSSVRGWFGDQLVKTAMIAPQVMKGATQSVVYALAFAALSNLVSPVGAGMLLNGTSIAGGASLLGWLSSMSRSAQTAAQIGSAVGNTMYLAQDVFPREYGTMSRQLEQLVDDYGNKMDKETRKKAASVYAVASTLIEFMTPEPGLGKLMYGIAPKAMTSTSFMGWLKRVGINMLQGGASESLEEAIQDFVGSFVQDVAKSKSNEKGTTNYELESFLDRLPGYVSQGFSTFMDTLVPSMIVGIPGAVTSSSLATYLTNVANEKDSIFRQASDDGRIAAMNTQKITSRAKIVPSIIIDTPTHSIAEFTSRIEETDEKGHLVTTEKLDPVKVRFDRARGRYVPIDDYNADLAKYIGVHIGNEAIAVEIVNDGAVRVTPDDIRNAAETSGGAVRDGSEIVFRTQNEAMQFASSLGESATLIRNDDGSIAIDYIDADGNEQIQGITIEENADIESLVQSEHARLGVNQPSQQSTAQSDNVQDTTEQTTVEDMAKAIHDASRGRITEKTANALARLFDIMPENVKNTIFTTNNGRLVITDKEYERITGRKLGNNSRAAAWLNRMQMIFTGKSDASSFVHEMGHLAILANPELEEGVRLAFAVNLDTQEGLDTFLRFIDENKDIIRVKSREEAINLLRELGDINRSGGFSENAEELLMSMLEAHFRADVRAENLTQLPQNIRDIFQKIANAIRRVYGRATGNTELPRDVQNAFNSFFWNGNEDAAGSIAGSQQNGIRFQPAMNTRSEEYIETENSLKAVSSNFDSEGRHLAPNGRPSNLAYEQWVTVRTPSFMAWFGDWINNAANASKVVDENGEPLVVLHGSRSDTEFSEFSDFGEGIFFTDNENVAATYLQDDNVVGTLPIFNVFLNLRNPLEFTADEEHPAWNDQHNYDLELWNDDNDTAIYEDDNGRLFFSKEQVEKYLEEHPELLEQYDEYDIGRVNEYSTREIVSYAMENGYDGVIIHDIFDVISDEDADFEDLIGTDYVAFRPEQIKSIDNVGTFDTENPDIRYQNNIGENAVERGQKKFMRMADDRFVRSIEKDIFLPEYVVKAKLGSENQSVVEIAKRELDDRDKFALLSPADSKAIFETDSADEYVSRMKESGTLSLADEADAERIYRKAWEYAHVMTPKEAVNTFKQRFGTLPGLIELKNILGPRRIQVTREGGGSYTRMYVPASNHIYQLLSKLNTNSPISEVNEVLSSMDSNPRAWLHAYQDAVNAGARIKGSLSEDQDVLDSYIDMADADFDIIKNELRRGEEPYGVSYDTVYGVSSADITNLSVEEAERLSREAGNTEESDNTVLTRDEAEKLKDSLGIARRAADRAINTARETEEKMSALKQKHAKEESQMKDTIQVLRKTVNRRTAEVKDLRERIARLADKNNQQAHEYSQKLREAESERNKAERERASAEKRLQDSRDSFNRRMEEMRKKVADARKEAHDQNIRANKLDRRLKALATKTMSERITRAIKGKLRINKKTHDMAMLEEPTYYIYYLMHNGQNRRFSENLSTERMNGVDAQLDKLRAGASDGLFVMDEDGNINSQTIDLSHTDANGNLVTSYSGNLGTYMYDRSQIPARLKKHLSKGTISKLESPGRVTWNSLTVGEKREIYDALVAVREESAVSRSDVADAIQTERRMLAREAARTVMEAPLGEITDEMREAVKKRLKSQDPDYDGTPTDEQVWDDIAKHPSQYMNAVEPGKTKEKFDAFRLSFLKMQRITRILDGGKEDGPFSRIFVRAFQNGYDKVLRNIDRRNSEFYSALEDIIGKKNSKGYKARIEDLRKTKMHFKTRAISGSGVDMNLLQVMAMYIYSQNIHGATKLLSTEGNNFSLEDIARVNPKKVAEYINLELTMRADRGRDASHPSPFILEGNDEVLIRLRDRINNGEIVSEVPEWVRNIGDMMIDQLAKETPRLAQAAYKDYNTLLEIQDRYFPLVPASRGSWGNIFGNPNKGGMAHVNSGSLNIRQQSARYPLLLDPFSTFMSAIREQENLINMSKPVSDAAYLLKFGRVEELVRNRFGDKWAKAIHEYVERIANPENHLTDVEKMFNRIYGNAAAAKIGLNLMTALKQFVSLVPAAFDGRLSVADVIRGFGHAIPHNKETAALMDEVAYSTLRSGYNVEISRLQHMDDISRLGTASQRFVEVSTWLTNKSDQLTKMIIWSAMYDKQMRAGSSEADAAYAATDLVNRTMSVTSPISLSEMQSKQNPFTRLMFMFTNDLFQMWNILYSDIPMDFKNKEYGRAFLRFSGVVLSATILGFLAGGWLPDKDDEEKFQADDLLKDIVDNLLGYGVPLLGQEVTEWTRGYSQDIISAPGEVYRVGSMIFKDLTSDKDYTADEYFDQIIDTLLAAGEMAGVPATGLKRPVQSVYDSDTGEWRLNLAYLFGTRWGDGAQNLLYRTVN